MLISRIKRLIFRRKNYTRIASFFEDNTDSLNDKIKPVKKLDPLCIPKYKNQLVKPPVYEPIVIKVKDQHGLSKKEHFYQIDISELKQQILPKGFPKTKVWGYGGLVKDDKTGKVRYVKCSPGPTFEAIKGIPVKVKWVNKLDGKHLFPVDPTLHWANPNHMPMKPRKLWPPFPPGFRKAQSPIPIVTHLHGGEVPSISDGHPEAWFTYDGEQGPEYVTSLYTYPNEQEPTTLWYHDHVLGMTRLNVYAGLAGFYLLRGGVDQLLKNSRCLKEYRLPDEKYEYPIVIQDRTFLADGSLFFDRIGVNPEDHPYWVPEFFGDTIMVNGKVWPNLDVDRCLYRFRLLNGSNARFYNLKLSNGMTMIQIGSDGGFLPKPVFLTSLLLAPGERADILIDFSGIEPGTKIRLLNDANAPYPDGDSPDPDTVGQIMQFTIPKDATMPVIPPKLPDYLNYVPDLKPDRKRILTLIEVQGNNGPLEVLLDGLKWSYPITEAPQVGSTEEWTIVNLTMDAHPIHLHLVQFRLYNRQDMDTEGYLLKWNEVNGTPPLNKPPIEVPVEPYLTGNPIPPDENETGWKDTIRVNPGQVTRIRIRFAPQNVQPWWVQPGDNLYPFDPAKGPGYVWHCHILDHEDNEMMRPYKVKDKK